MSDAATAPAISEITRHETAERARLLDVEAYDITLDFTLSDTTFRSVSVIRFSCREPGASTHVDLVAPAVHEITLNGVAIDPAEAFRAARIALPDLAANNELRVVADCAYSHEGAGAHRAVDSADGRVYLYTKLEPAEARRVYANFEQPDLKSAFTFHVIAPDHWTVMSNQPTPASEPRDGGLAVWHFEPTPRISTYLTAIVAGDYVVVESEHTTPRGQRIPMRVAGRASLAEFLDAEDIFDVTGRGFDFFTGLFDLDYPYAKYDQVFVPEFSAGAMENVGCVTISEMLVFRSKTTDLFYELRANTILHEMAHMWFGDLVTMRWWDDLWLNESFAEFCATLASAEATRFTDAWTTFSGARKVWGYGQDQLPSTHPIAADIDTLTEAVANFDGISYAKGASVLKQLVAFIGRDNFFTGIRAYFAEHAGGNATLADLLRALEKSSGIDLSEWTRAWLQTAGPNSVRSDFTLDDTGAFASFTVVQEAPAAFPTLRPHHLAIGLYALQDGSLVRTHQVEVDVAGARTDVPELVGVAQPDLILLNDDDLSFVLIRFDERSLATLGTSIGHFRDSLARTVCWSAVIDMASQAEMSVPAFVRIVASGMVVEPSVTVLQILHFFSRGLLTSADPAWIGQGRATLADAAVPMLHAAVPGSDAQLIWAQLVGSTAATEDQLDLLAGLLDGSVEIEGLAVDTDLRWTLLSRLAATGRADAAAIDAEAARDATDAGARHATACRAAIPVAERKAEAWRQLTESEELGYEGVQEVAVAFTDPGQAELLQPYVERYFQALPGLWASRSEVYRMLLCAMIFPHYAASLELIERVDSFLAAGDRDPALVRLLTEQRDRVTRALKSRTLPVG